MVEFSEKTTRAMAQTMADVTSDPDKIPGCVSVIIGKTGKLLFQHARHREYRAHDPRKCLLDRLIYSFVNEKFRLYGAPIGINEIDANMHDIPLLYEPGTDWSYGVGIDWAGEINPRLTSISLNAYFQTYIFAPLGLHHISMLPTPQMIAQLAHMH
ncbi:MAG: hypothetical protein Q9164_001234 [Protoblastenia rupestris]